MNILKISFLFLIVILLTTSCRDKVDPVDAYIGQWTLVDASGDGTIAIGGLDSEFDTTIDYASSDAYININADKTFQMSGELSVTIDVYLDGVLVQSVLADLGNLDAENVWTLDADDNFQSPEFEEANSVDFDGNILKMISTEEIDMDGIEATQELEFIFERNL